MFSRLFHRSSAAAEPTFLQRVLEFWRWFEEVAPRFYAGLEAAQRDDLTRETAEKIDELLPGFGWVYGPGADRIGHSFTLTGEGVEAMQLLSRYWLSQAPSIPGWTFYSSRQPDKIEGTAINFGPDLEIDAKAIWVTPELDEEEEMIHLTLWNPQWQELEEGQRWRIAFLFLDESLGEYGVQRWLGKIHFGNHKLGDSFPLHELSGHIDGIARERGWKLYPPGELSTLFRLKSTVPGRTRGDLLTLTTQAPHLFRDFMEAEGKLADPFEKLGADYVYLSIPKKYFLPGREVEIRGGIEDALEDALTETAQGRCLGGGMGTDRTYVDLLIYDGAQSIQRIRETVRPMGLPRGTTLEYFAESKRSRRIEI